MLDADVVVAGAGPVGMSLGVALATRGRRVIVLEALSDLNNEERASTFHPPTLEMLAEWGILDETVRRGRVIDRLQYWERQSHELVADFPYSLISDDTSCPFRLQCPQSVVTRLLRPRLLASGGILALGHEVTKVIDRGNYVEVTARKENCDRTFRASYAVGADGPASRIRKSLGLRLAGKTYPDRFLLVGAAIDLALLFPGMGPVAYIFDPEEWVIVMHLPDRVRFVFRLGPREDEAVVMSESSIRARMARFLTQKLPFGIKSVSIYSVHQRVAEQFRQGRVLLAGDAAHINNPVGGFGMNAGIHDAHDLAGALDAALISHEGPALDDYARARRAVALERVNEDADDNYRSLAARERRAREARNRTLREAASDPVAARLWLLRASMLEDGIGRTTGSGMLTRKEQDHITPGADGLA
jgi:3-(3-hydroxy-phenyl)propionate hydroxylase